MVEKDIEVSIVVPCLNSHEALRRYLLHFEKIGIPDDTEVLIVDDGSDPPLDCKWARVHRTNDFRPWTWALARNAGAREAKGDKFIMVDLDHIIDRPLIDAVRAMKEDYMRFWREFAVIDENGVLTQDVETLVAYGWPRERWATRGVALPPHRNQFAMSRNLWDRMGGYIETRVGLPYPQREDGDFHDRWVEMFEKGEINMAENRPTLYMYPNGKYCGDVDFNPKNLFHNLTRKNRKNFWYRKQRKELKNAHI